MTDRTHPDSGRIITSGDVIAELQDRIAELEAELEAVGAGGVQALSAAPAEVQSPWSRALEIRMAQGWKLKGDRVPVLYTDSINGEGVGRDDLWLCTTGALAASPTPPAEQQATKETSGGFHVWRDISTAPKDGSRFVATGHNYGLYSEVRHACVAQWFRGCWIEASDWNATSELKYLTHWMPLPSPPDDVAAPAEQQAAPKAAAGEMHDHQILAITTAYEQGVGKGRQAHESGKEIANPYGTGYRCDLAWQYGYKEGKKQQAAPKAAPGESLTRDQIREVFMAHGFTVKEGQTDLKQYVYDAAHALLELVAAPQQEAQEPAFWMNEKGHTWSHSDWKQFPKHRAKYPIPLYPHFPAPQPAPATLSDDAKDAERYRWLRATTNYVTSNGERIDVRNMPEKWDAAIDAALAAQGGKCPVRSEP